MVVGGRLDVCASWQSCHCEALPVGADMTCCLFLILLLSGWHRTFLRVKRRDLTLLMGIQLETDMVTLFLWLPRTTCSPLFIPLACHSLQRCSSTAPGLRRRKASSTSALSRPQGWQAATVPWHHPTGRRHLCPPGPRPTFSLSNSPKHLYSLTSFLSKPLSLCVSPKPLHLFFTQTTNSVIFKAST